MLPQDASFSRAYIWMTARFSGTNMPPYFFAAERPNAWSSALIVPPTAQSELWQQVMA